MSFPPKQEGQLPHVYAIKLYFLCGFAFFFLLIQTFVHFLTKLQVTTLLLNHFWSASTVKSLCAIIMYLQGLVLVIFNDYYNNVTHSQHKTWLKINILVNKYSENIFHTWNVLLYIYRIYTRCFLAFKTFLKMVMKEKEPFDHITNLYSKFYTKQFLSAIRQF